MRSWKVLTAVFLAVVSPILAQETWTQKFPAQSPPITGGPLVYDTARHLVVLYTDCGSVPGNTWVWDGNSWTQKFPITSPPARCGGPAMVYDSFRSEVVLFGGNIGGTDLNDTWVWDGTNWTQRSPAPTPSPRTNLVGAYDAARQQFVLFGGLQQTPYGLLGDTWVWDGSNWTQKLPAHSPSPRNDTTMAYDAARQQVVLFGGGPCNGCPAADTWVWDGTDWTQKNPNTSPPARYNSNMAYDTAGQQILLFGGFGAPCSGACFGNLGDTWTWDGTNWTQRFPLSSPAGRGVHGMAGDTARLQVVLFGGSQAFVNPFNDTWVWGTPFAAQVQPPINADGSSVFNAKRGVVPVKFTLTNDGSPTCDLPSATISLFRTSGGTPGVVNEGDYTMPADNGSNFRVSDCQYVYNLDISQLGAGTYQGEYQHRRSLGWDRYVRA